MCPSSALCVWKGVMNSGLTRTRQLVCTLTNIHGVCACAITAPQGINDFQVLTGVAIESRGKRAGSWACPLFERGFNYPPRAVSGIQMRLALQSIHTCAKSPLVSVTYQLPAGRLKVSSVPKSGS